MDARLERRGRGRPGADLRPGPHRRRGHVHPRRGAGRARARRRARRVLERFPGRALEGVRYEPPFDFIPGSAYGAAGPHRAARRLRHRRGRHRPRAHGDRVRRGRLPARRAVRPERRSTRSASTAPTTSGSAVRRPLGQGRRPGPDRGPADSAGRLLRAESYEHSYPTAGAAARRCSTTPSRPGTSAPARSRTACWPPTRPSTGIPSTSSTAASATGSRATSTGRSRASATGARRCRSGAARTSTSHAIGSFAELDELSGTRARPTRTGRSSTRSRSRAPSAARRCAASPR